jgi:hypothetical protein
VAFLYAAALVMRVEWRRSHSHLSGVTNIRVAPMARESWLMRLAEEYSSNQFWRGARPSAKGEVP